jgi:arylsulfatase A-like enzyme
MTGQHTGHTFIRGNYPVKPMGQLPLPGEKVTVAKHLKKAGYKTGLIGKWGLGGPGSEGIPGRQGFDYFYGYLCQRHAHNYYPEFLFKNQKRVKLDNKVDNGRTDGAGQAKQKKTYSHDLLMKETWTFIEKYKNDPFFLYLALTIPHANNEAGDQGMEVPELGKYERRPWPEPEKGKAAMITRLDKDIGRLLFKLKELEIDKNTLVIFSSDNGPHREGGVNPEFFNSSGPFRGIKRDLYEGGIRVPMIAWWPGTIKAGSITGHVSSFWDFLPTACDIASVKLNSNIDGLSYLPTLLGDYKTQSLHKYLYWEFHESKSSSQAVRMGKWKGLRHGPRQSLELYDLELDKSETRNVAAKNKKVVAKIESIMNQARTPSDIWELKSL